MLPFARHSPKQQTIAVKKHQNLRRILKKSVIVVACTLSSCNWLVDVKNPLGTSYLARDITVELDLHPQTPENTLVDLRVTNKSDQNMCISKDIQFYYDQDGILQLTYGDNLVNEDGLPELHHTLAPGNTFTLHKDMSFGINMQMGNYNTAYGHFNADYLLYNVGADSTQIFNKKYLNTIDFYF